MRTAPSTIFRLTTPCADCPFRADKPFYLGRERATEIAQSLQQGSRFSCHKTTRETGSGNEAFCAGALVIMESAGQPNQAMRMAERLGLYDPSLLDMEAPVYGSFAEFVKGCDA